MFSFLDSRLLARAYRDPIAWVILAVDLFPIVAVLTLGWGAVALVFLYWLENLILGVVALARMTGASVKHGPQGLIGMAFLGPFFTVHYGMFCFVHGVFVATFAIMAVDGQPDFPTPNGLLDFALSSGAHMPVFVLAIILLQVFLFVQDFVLRGEYRKATVDKEMMAPYGRIVVLHIGLFAGAFALVALGEPMLGILALIGLRAFWGVVLTLLRRQRLDNALQLKS
ncbi:MAG: DUF6498-containing protein [Pseudomonadota bacterium]